VKTNLEGSKMKKCSKCRIEKEICDFNQSKLYPDGKRSECRECQKISSKIYREKNRNKINEKAREQYKVAPDIQRERTKKWEFSRNEDFRNSYLKRNKKWEEKNKDYRKKYKNEYSTQRLKTDILFKIKRNVRIRINKFIKNKSKSTESIVGLPFIELKLFLEQQFINGMNWDNYGDWHIDHVIPLSSATNEEEIYKLCHYTNLQPLWAEDNLKKSSKILK
jgi:hypothetical protein